MEMDKIWMLHPYHCWFKNHCWFKRTALGGVLRFLTECLVCSGVNLVTHMESTFSGTSLEAAQFFLANRRGVVHGQIQQCQSCGFIFTNPQFSSSEYDEIYKNSPGPGGSKITLEAGDARRFRRLATLVRNDAGHFDRFLDFGCGRGGFLEAMNDPAGIGFEVGDPGIFSVGLSRVTTGNFLEVAGGSGFEKGTFDLITAFDVFEHLPNLEEYVHTLRGLLRPGGYLIITVPDIGSWNAKLSGRRWNMYLLEHLWYFNRTTLRSFMTKTGFRQMKRRTLPYDAPVAHIVRRTAQTYGFSGPRLSSALFKVVVPVPIGIIYGAFRAVS